MDGEAADLLDRIRRFAMPDGGFAPREVVLVQEGEMRLAPDAEWRPFRARQRMACGALNFCWRAWFRLAPLAPFRVIDAFENGSGRLKVTAFGVVPVARAHGPDVDRGEVQRALAELPWRPSAFGRLPNVDWEAQMGGTLRLAYDDRRVRATAELEIDEAGRVTGGGALRPRLVGKTCVDTAWRGTFGDYRRFGGVRIPTAAEVA